MTQAQQRFLLNRLDTARGTKPRQWDAVSIPVTQQLKDARVAVAKANRVISAYEKRVRNAQTKRRDRIANAFQDTKTKVLFGDHKAALKAVEKFERTAF